MVRTRFAPSPSGFLHIGGVRTALYAWLYARNQKGKFLLRIENTHIKRSTQESVNSIIEGMKWLGLDHDEDIIIQQNRFDIYKERAYQLVNNDKAYKCDCSPERLNNIKKQQIKSGDNPHYDGHCRERSDEISENYVVRLKSDRSSSVIINDGVYGDVEVNAKELDDFIIMRSNGAPTYHLAVVVDDYDSAITHVMRGDDHLKNSAKHIQLMEAFGYPLPNFIHLPMILGSDGSRLSKRHGAMNVLQYRDEGYTPDAVLNYLLRLGWSRGDKEIFTIKEMIDGFSISGINKSSAKFDIEKLRWVNQQHLLETSNEEILGILNDRSQMVNSLDERTALNFIQAYKSRANTINDIIVSCEQLFSEKIDYDEDASQKFLKTEIVVPFQDLLEMLEQIEWNAESVNQSVKSICKKHDIGFGNIGQPLRVAITGGTESPSIDLTMTLLDREIVISRIKKAIEYISNQ